MPLPELTPGASLASLITACETYCVHDCCGIDAFHFSPLHVAAYMSAHSGEIEVHRTQEVIEQLAALVAEAEALDANEDGFVCSVAGTNEYFSLSKLQRLASRIRWALESAPSVLACSNALEDQYNTDTAEPEI